MKIISVVVLILLSASNLVAQNAKQPADMTECIALIKAWGMSEFAQQNLEAIAGMRIGASNWAYNKDEASGVYWNSYTGNRCNLPNQDPEQAEREKMEYKYKLDSEVTRLKSLADSDCSGFVSSDEGLKFRKLIEFGYKAAFVTKEEKGDKEKVCLGLQVELRSDDLEVLHKKLKEYELFRIEAEKKGIADFPTVILN